MRVHLPRLLRRVVTHYRWRAAVVGAVVVLALAWPHLSQNGPVNAATKELVWQVALEFNRLLERANLHLNSNILLPRATTRFAASVDKSLMPSYGPTVCTWWIAGFWGCNLKGFRPLNVRTVELDVVRIWQNRYLDRTGKVVYEAKHDYDPLTITFVLENGRRKVDALTIYEIDEASFL